MNFKFDVKIVKIYLITNKKGDGVVHRLPYNQSDNLSKITSLP